MASNSKKLSVQTKSFIVLFSIAVIGTVICLIVIKNDLPRPAQQGAHGNYQTTVYGAQSENPAPAKTIAQLFPAPTPADTTGWKTYSDSAYGFSFLYNPAWKITAFQKGTYFDVLRIDPGAKYYDFKIYASPTQFFSMVGLPAQTETINGLPALNVENVLYGIQHAGMYYTFDIGYSLSLTPQFDAMVKSIHFEN